MSVLLEGARNELVPKSLEAAPDASVDHAVTDSDDQATQQAGVLLDLEFDAAAGQLLQPLGQGADLVLGQRRGGDGSGFGDALAGVVEPSEFGGESG